MDQTRFDQRGKRSGTALNRRQLLRGVIGGMGAITLAGVSEQGAGARSNCDPAVDPIACPPTTTHSGLIELATEECGTIDDACGYELPKTGRAAIRAARSRSVYTTAIVGGAMSLVAATALRRTPTVAAPIHLEPVPSVISVGAAFEQTNTVVYDTASPAADLKGVRFTIDRYDAPPALEFKQRAAELREPVGSRGVVGYAFGDQALLFYSSKGTPAPDAWLLVRDGPFLEQWYVMGDTYVSTRLFSLATTHYASPRGQTMTERLLQLSELPKGFKETCNTFGNPSILCREYEREGIIRSEKS